MLPSFLALLAAVTATTVAGPAATADDSDYGEVTVVHAIPRLRVDVYANGHLLLEDFRPGAIAGPVSLPEGSYRLKVTAANDSKAVLAGTAKLDEGDDVSIVAFPNRSGAPQLGIFGNDITSIQAGRARVTVRHVAVAPKVDVAIRRHDRAWKTVIEGLRNGEEETASLEAGRIEGAALLSGTDTRAIGPAELRLRSHRHYFVYAWGNPDKGYDFLVQTRVASKR